MTLRGRMPRPAHADRSTRRAGWSLLWERALQIVLAGKSPRHPPKKVEKAVAERGVYGALAILLNDGPVSWDHRGRPTKSATDSVSRAPSQILAGMIGGGRLRAVLPESVIDISKGTGHILRVSFTHGGWPGLQYALLQRRGVLGNARSEMLWRVAIIEALVFAQAGFDIGWCKHGRHWYVRKDVRQMECPRHKKAGQQARWWKWARKQHRGGESRSRTHGRSGAAGRESSIREKGSGKLRS